MSENDTCRKMIFTRFTHADDIDIAYWNVDELKRNYTNISTGAVRMGHKFNIEKTKPSLYKNLIISVLYYTSKGAISSENFKSSPLEPSTEKRLVRVFITDPVYIGIVEYKMLTRVRKCVYSCCSNWRTLHPTVQNAKRKQSENLKCVVCFVRSLFLRFLFLSCDLPVERV